jgi:hypothetical protein
MLVVLATLPSGNSSVNNLMYIYDIIDIIDIQDIVYYKNTFIYKLKKLLKTNIQNKKLLTKAPI